MAMAQLNVTDGPPNSWTGDGGRVQVEGPSVVGRRQPVPARLLGLGCVLVLEVVAYRRLDLALSRVEADPEHARADARVELPRLNVDGPAVAQQRCRVSVGTDTDLGGAEARDRQVGCGRQHLRRHDGLLAG